MRVALAELRAELAAERAARCAAETRVRDTRVRSLLRGWFHRHITPVFAAWARATREARRSRLLYWPLR